MHTFEASQAAINKRASKFSVHSYVQGAIGAEKYLIMIIFLIKKYIH